jgi:hypothetical protein
LVSQWQELISPVGVIVDKASVSLRLPSAKIIVGKRDDAYHLAVGINIEEAVKKLIQPYIVAGGQTLYEIGVDAKHGGPHRAVFYIAQQVQKSIFVAS